MVKTNETGVKSLGRESEFGSTVLKCFRLNVLGWGEGGWGLGRCQPCQPMGRSSGSG